MAPIKHVLPEGLKYHCSCGIVVPSDAPEPDDSALVDCDSIVRAKLTYFNPATTVASQFCMAAAAWDLIHHKAVKAEHPESVEYLRQFKLERGSHYAQSATYKALTDEQVKAEIEHEQNGRRDKWIYESHPVAAELKAKETTEYVAEKNVKVVDGNK